VAVSFRLVVVRVSTRQFAARQPVPIGGSAPSALVGSLLGGCGRFSTVFVIYGQIDIEKAWSPPHSLTMVTGPSRPLPDIGVDATTRAVGNAPLPSRGAPEPSWAAQMPAVAHPAALGWRSGRSNRAIHPLAG